MQGNNLQHETLISPADIIRIELEKQCNENNEDYFGWSIASTNFDTKCNKISADLEW